MIRVHVFAKNADYTRENFAKFFVDSEDKITAVVYRAACLIDLGGRIDVYTNGVQSGEYATLADVPRPVLRKRWRIDTRITGGIRWESYEPNKADALRTKAARLELWPQATVKITRVTVRRKARAR